MATIRRLRGRWQAMVRRKRTVARCRSFDRRIDAIRWARELEAVADRSAELGGALAAKLTLSDLLIRYRDQVSPTKRGACPEQVRISAMARKAIGGRPLSKLTSADLATYRDERLREVAPATVLRELNLLSHVMDVATREWGLPLPYNPAKLVRRPTVRNERKRRLTEGEEERLLVACDAGRNRLMKPLLILALETAMRRGEILNLKWADVDLARRIAHVHLSKNGESRAVPLTQHASETLQQMAGRQTDAGALVFPLSANAVRLAFERIRTRAGIANLRFHDLRHEAISRLFEHGLHVLEVAAISGHRELRMLRRYTHLRASDLVAKLDQCGSDSPAPLVQHRV